jgi:hypothetical protein
MLSSKALKDIVAEARPIIERQLDDADRISGLRELVTAQGGDWSSLKALIKAQVQDERDESGEQKRVRKILDRADYSTAYADMLGLANMNEKNFFVGDEELPEHDPETGEITPAGDTEEINSEVMASGAFGLAGAVEEIGPDALRTLSDAILGTIVSAIAIPEPQRASDAARDLIDPVPQAPDQVAPIQPETANERVDDLGSVQDALKMSTDGQPAEGLGNSDGRTPGEEKAGVTGGESAATNGVVLESTPRMPVERPKYAHHFPELTADDVAKVKALIADAPFPPTIVRMGNIILDGWDRYLAARDLGIAYEVHPYRGKDPLIDFIGWQRESREFTAKQEREIAGRLVKAIPNRAADIFQAFDLDHEAAVA